MFSFLKKLFFWILSSMYNHMIKLLKGKHAHHSMLKWFSYTMKSLMQFCTTRHAMMIQKLHLISVKWSLICLKIHNVCKEHFFLLILLMRSSFHFWQLFIFLLLKKTLIFVYLCFLLLLRLCLLFFGIYYLLLNRRFLIPSVLCVCYHLLCLFSLLFSHLISALHLLLFFQLILMEM